MYRNEKNHRQGTRSTRLLKMIDQNIGNERVSTRTRIEVFIREYNRLAMNMTEEPTSSSTGCCICGHIGKELAFIRTSFRFFIWQVLLIDFGSNLSGSTATPLLIRQPGTFVRRT